MVAHVMWCAPHAGEGHGWCCPCLHGSQVEGSDSGVTVSIPHHFDSLLLSLHSGSAILMLFFFVSSDSSLLLLDKEEHLFLNKGVKLDSLVVQTDIDDIFFTKSQNGKEYDDCKMWLTQPRDVQQGKAELRLVVVLVCHVFQSRLLRFALTCLAAVWDLVMRRNSNGHHLA
eukprot:2156385-Amphidinium_carterae.1